MCNVLKSRRVPLCHCQSFKFDKVGAQNLFAGYGGCVFYGKVLSWVAILNLPWDGGKGFTDADTVSSMAVETPRKSTITKLFLFRDLLGEPDLGGRSEKIASLVIFLSRTAPFYSNAGERQV